MGETSTFSPSRKPQEFPTVQDSVAGTSPARRAQADREDRRPRCDPKQFSNGRGRCGAPPDLSSHLAVARSGGPRTPPDETGTRGSLRDIAGNRDLRAKAAGCEG